MATFEIRPNTDMFSIECDAYAHGVNGLGLMGAGVAKLIRARHPGVYEAYKQYCKDVDYDEAKLGGECGCVADGNLFIFNLFTQYQPGKYARIEYCRKAFTKMFSMLEVIVHGDGTPVKQLVMPAIGSGIGGLVWEDVFEELVQANANTTWDGKIIIALI